MLMCRGKESALAGRYMRWELLIFLTERGLTAMRIELRSLEQSRAEQSRAWANCALFASCDSEAFETEYYIRDG